MSRILVSILSDHTIPNFLFIKETHGEYDQNIFITTQQVEDNKRDIDLEKALGLRNVRRIKVSNDNYFKIMEKLSSEPFDSDAEYCVNQTGGTKVMSIAAFNFFSKFNARFVYVPIGTNKYCEFDSDRQYDLNYRLSLKEYFSLYGISFESNNTMIYNSSVAFNLFDRICSRNFYLPKQLMNSQQLPTAEERVYYGGQWFEDYVYKRIKSDYNLPDDAIAKSLKIYRGKIGGQNDNELDVAFVKDNKLTVIECKVTMFGYGKPNETIEEYLYKLAAISKDFGLVVNSYIFTLHKMEKISSNFDKRIKILGIKGIYDGKRIAETDLKL